MRYSNILIYFQKRVYKYLIDSKYIYKINIFAFEKLQKKYNYQNKYKNEK